MKSVQYQVRLLRCYYLLEYLISDQAWESVRDSLHHTPIEMDISNGI